jgi:membrane fusion protein (multidrug efflux system)
LQRLKAQHVERAQELENDKLRIETALARNQGEQAEQEKRIAQMDHEQEQYRVRAPSSGTLADVTPITNGTQVKAGDLLGQLLVAEQHVVRASFDPAAAIGKLHPGDTASLRLQGFPWLQFGEVQLQVSEVASESRNGRIRVDFAITHTPKAIALRHGLPGQVLVETERITPYKLLLRTIGGSLPQTNTGATSSP